MSLFLVALAAWCVPRAGEAGVLPGRMIAAGVALALANATSYSTVLFDVLVLVAVVLAAFPAPGGRVALRRMAILAATVIALLAAGLLIGGSNYLNGVKATILTPVAHTSSPLSVLSSTWYWASILVILAVAGVVFSAVRREVRAQTWLLAVLAAAAILGPATELHHNPDYHTIAVVPYGIEVPPYGQGTYVIWKIRAPALTEVPGPVHALPADSGS